MNLNILNNTGGIQYHLRAVWNKKRWRPFCDFVESWLMEWAEKSKLPSTLVLVGPNAGYTLARNFLAQFRNIIVVDPDPLAFALFQARLALPAQWVGRDFFALNEKVPNPEKLHHLFQSYPEAAFLFCNVLGQLPVILREKNCVDIEKYMYELGVVLRDEMKRHPVASYHDRYSRNTKKPSEMLDHLTGDLFVGCPDKKEFPWRLTSRLEHQIEFVRG